MTKEEYKAWFISTPPSGSGDDVLPMGCTNDAQEQLLFCACPLHITGTPESVILTLGEYQELCKERLKAWSGDAMVIKADYINGTHDSPIEEDHTITLEHRDGNSFGVTIHDTRTEPQKNTIHRFSKEK